MRKTGYFFLSFVPLIAALGIMYMSLFFTIGMCLLFAVPTSSSVTDILGDAWMEMLSDNDFTIFAMIIYSLIVICTYGLLYYRNFGGDFLPRPSVTFHPLQVIATVVLVPGTQFASSFIITIMAEIFPSAWETYEQLFDSAGLTEVTFISFCYSVILAPIGEELIFRGITLKCLRVAVPFWLANILQAVLFGVFHMNFIQGCYAAVLGLLLGYVCEKGGSIYYSIFFHFLFNLWGTVLYEFLYIDNEVIMFLVMVIGTVLSLSLGLFMFYYGGRMNAEKNARKALNSAGNMGAY